MLGKKSTIWGKATRIMKHMSKQKRKGVIPRKMVYMGTSFATPAITKTFKPNGGVIMAIS
jgi:hypothetical protein